MLSIVSLETLRAAFLVQLSGIGGGRGSKNSPQRTRVRHGCAGLEMQLWIITCGFPTTRWVHPD